MKSADDLLKLLIEIDKHKARTFTGLGLIMFSDIGNLPKASMKNVEPYLHLPLISYDEVLNFLIKSARATNKYHDGFHLLNKNLELTHVAQYLAPRITKTQIEHEFGSRYTTAIYASKMPGIIASGVLSKNYPPTVFRKGKSIY